MYSSQPLLREHPSTDPQLAAAQVVVISGRGGGGSGWGQEGGVGGGNTTAFHGENEGSETDGHDLQDGAGKVEFVLEILEIFHSHAVKSSRLELAHVQIWIL